MICFIYFVEINNDITDYFFHVNSSQRCFISISDKGESFQSDHAALLSILRNEGISATGLGSVTPKSKPYNYLVSWFSSYC